MKRHLQCAEQQDLETFSIELVFACHASSDPNDLVLDLLGKFSVDFKFVQEVSYLAELPEKTFRKQQPYVHCQSHKPHPGFL